MSEFALLSRSRCQEIFDRVKKFSSTDDFEILLIASRQALTRFANNVIHQNMEEETQVLSVRVVIGQRTARATTNRLDDDSIRRVVEEAAAIAKFQTPDPDLPPMAEPFTYKTVERFDEPTAETSAHWRAGEVKEAVDRASANSMTAAGVFATGASAEAILNSRGLFAYHAQTRAEASITAIAPDSSGWAKSNSVRVQEIDPPALASRAVEIASASRHPVKMEPGAYTVVLERAAVLDLLGFLAFDFSATAVRDKRSFLTDRIGKQLFGANITICDDVYHPLQSGAPFDGEGVPRQPLVLVDRGIVRNVAYSRRAAKAAGVEPTGHGFPLPTEYGEAPVNIVFSGGDQSVDQLIHSVDRGVLVTRLWYIREVDPYEKILTGMTRDGTFLIEGGKIVHGVRNFRFNQSMIELLNNVELMSPAERTAGEEAFEMVVPALKARSFHFTAVTKF
ncbi:MAG TPA: TldD/PmbA family protein [Bryobacterales bacterium]|jgi:PmbA protein|nr:TldD/PmbA family protein [Bryobacterales bacterium]